MTATNPFFEPSPLYLQYPPFDLVENEHYLPAFERGMEEHLTEIEAIANNPEPATFDNTFVAMERSGAVAMGLSAMTCLPAAKASSTTG